MFPDYKFQPVKKEEKARLREEQLQKKQDKKDQEKVAPKKKEVTEKSKCQLITRTENTI